MIRATVGNAVKPLLKQGLVIELADQNDGGNAGHLGVLVSLNPGAYFIAFDISTTSFNAVLIDLSMNVVAKKALRIDADYRDSSYVIELLADLPRQLLNGARAGASAYQSRES
jgi:hypothetical protein